MGDDSTPGAAPRLRFPEFRDAPAWERRKLSYLLVERKLRNRESMYGPPDVLSVSGEVGCVNQIELLGRSYAGVSVKDYHVVETGDLVYTKSPLKKNPFGIIKENKGKPGIVSTLYAVYRTTDTGHPSFLDHYFSRDYHLNSYLEPIVRKGAKNDMKVNNSAVLSGDIFVPCIREQAKVAEFLTSLDEVITAHAQRVKALKAHMRGLMQQLFPREGETVPRFRFPEFRQSPAWVDKGVEDLYEFKPTNSYSRDQLNYVTGSTRNIHYGDIHTRFATQFYIREAPVPFVNSDQLLAGVAPDTYCQAGDMVIADASENLADVGKSIEIVDLDGERVLAGSHTILARRRSDNPVVGFGGYLFKAPIIRAQIEREAQGTKVMGISPSRLARVKVRLPLDEGEQQQIAKCLGSLDVDIASQSETLDALRLYKAALMQQLFTPPPVD